VFGFLKKIFGGSSSAAPEKPAKKSVGSPRRKKTAPPRRDDQSAAPPPEKRPRRRRSRSGARPERAENAAPQAPAPARKELPVCPEELNDVPVCPGKTRFLDLPLDKRVQFGVQHAGFEYCTPIQAMTLPVLLEGRDLAGKAQTGTGKTAAFLLAAFTKMLSAPAAEVKNGRVRMLVLAPTRELAMQIHKDAENLGVFTGLTFRLVFGGMDYEKQRRSLDCPIDVLIGTPGRTIDFLRHGLIDLSKVEILVIDEADRMLDMGFIPDIKRIVSSLPRRENRQTALFSATLDPTILRLASGWLTDPIVLESEPEQMVSDNIEQTFLTVTREEKLAVLLNIFNTRQYDRILVFGNRKDVNLQLQYDLAKYGYNVPVLSGDIAQEKRIRILERFRTGEEKIVIATDVAARGIHVDDVSIVVNYDLPERPEDYIHRIGRTGRAGHTGVAISFLCEYGAFYLPAIEELLKVQFHSTLPEESMLKLPPPAEHPQLPEKPVRGRRSGAPRGRMGSGRRR
jgi:ATP-dependent RNA helicase RhlB